MVIPIHRVLILLALLSLISPLSISSELDENLLFLTPLIGIDWVGGYIGEDTCDLKIALRFDPILDGSVVEYTREVPDADYSSVTHIFWDPLLKAVRFLSLNNRGIVGEGTVSVDGDEMTFQGEDHQPTGLKEFKTVLSISGSGTLKDLFLRKEKGKWIQGHIQEFTGSQRGMCD